MSLVRLGLGAYGLAASVGCALPDYEVGSLPGDAAIEHHETHDAGAHDATAHDAAKRHDARADRGAETVTPPSICASKTYPPPPTGPDVPGVGTFTLAIRSIDLGEADVVPPGYDLDHTCTCIDDGGPSCKSPQQHCDKPGGVDNGALGLIQSFELTQPAAFGSVPFSERAEMGGWSLLLQISGYGTSPDGGVADDPDVQVNVFASSGSITQPPMWMGDDAWLVAASSVLDGGIAQPRYTSPGAYVANHVLVAALPEIEITLSGGTMQTITMRLSSGFITGTLDVAAGQIKISDGIIAFRWAEPDIFGAVSSYRDGSGKAICTDNVVYPVTKSTICAGLDILVNGSDPASLPCNAVSTGIGFTAFPILPLAQVGPSTIPSGSCPVATDPAHDSCDAGGAD